MADKDWETSLNELEKQAKDLREIMMAALEKDGADKSDLAAKLDELDAEIAKVKGKVFPPEEDMPEDKAKAGCSDKDKQKADDAEKGDDADEAAKAKGKQFPPGKPGEGDDEEDMPPGKAKKDDEQLIAWPRDMAAKHFREGVEKKLDPARDWGHDPGYGE